MPEFYRDTNNTTWLMITKQSWLASHGISAIDMEGDYVGYDMTFIGTPSEYSETFSQLRVDAMTPLTLVSPDENKEKQEKIEELRRDLLDLVLMTEGVEVAPGILTWEDNRGDSWSLKSLATNALGLAQQIFD
jgi:hypothetical protein